MPNNPYAFPQPLLERSNGNIEHSGDHMVGGMGLRDYFAGQALAGLLSAYSGSDSLPPAAVAAAMAYDYANAMLAEAKKGGA